MQGSGDIFALTEIKLTVLDSGYRISLRNSICKPWGQINPVIGWLFKEQSQTTYLSTKYRNKDYHCLKADNATKTAKPTWRKSVNRGVLARLTDLIFSWIDSAGKKSNIKISWALAAKMSESRDKKQGGSVPAGHHYLLSDENPCAQSGRCTAAVHRPPTVSLPWEAFCQGLIFLNALSLDDKFSLWCSAALEPSGQMYHLQTFLLKRWEILASWPAVREQIHS